MTQRPVQVELSAVIFALDTGEDAARPVVLTPRNAEHGRDLPTARFDPDRHPTLQTALRDWVSSRTGMDLGHVEQLYTFGDPVRSLADWPGHPHTASIGYIALARPEAVQGPDWTDWTLWFPWEDHRDDRPPLIDDTVAPLLARWSGAGQQDARRSRALSLFGLEGRLWREDLVLERYELLYEADLVPEAWHDRGQAPPDDLPRLGQPAPRDHRRILATGIGRLRAKLKYRPVLFDLVGDRFTLFELQRAAEAVSGRTLHKQNFRRMVARSGLVEPTGGQSVRHGGRPAAEHRFAPEAAWERLAGAIRFSGNRRGG